MRAWRVTEPSGAGAMQWLEVPVPAPASDECLLEVFAAGVNFLDTLMVRGQYQRQLPLPFTPGIEVVGTVKESGPDSPYTPGDRLCATLDCGGYAEFALTRSKQALRLPDDVSFTAAMGLCITYPTAYLALRELARLRERETVLVLAGAGGVGSATIQLAKHWGARVIAAAGGEEKAAACRELGADVTIDYLRQPLTDSVRRETDGRGVDVAIDPVGGSATLDALRSLSWGGRLVIVGFASGRIPELPANRMLLKAATVAAVYWGEYRVRHPARAQAVLDELFRLVRQKVARPLIGMTLPLDRAPEALAAVATRATVGKAILTLSSIGQPNAVLPHQSPE